MSTQSTSRRALRALTWLLIITASLVALIGGGVIWDKQSWTPKLALDLEGGTEIILAPQVQEGTQLSEEQLAQAVGIIRARVDAAGVSESEVATQGGTNIVVSIPGTPDQATLDRIRSSAKLEFRAVLLTDAVATLEAVGGTAGGTTETPAPTITPWPAPTAEPTDGSDANWIDDALYQRYLKASCDELDAAGANVADPTKPLVICSDDGLSKYVLGPVEVDGSMIANAQGNYLYGSNGVQTNEWGVYLTFNAEGTTAFSTVTQRLTVLTGARNQFAIVLDGRVISAPRTISAISDGKPVISGSFTETSAKALSDQLKFGALPIGFEVQSSDTVTPTLGVAQLQSGLIAGAIGLLLVIIYSLVQYRALAIVTISSLIVAFGLTYLVITYLSAANGYRLSLAGVAGLIVAIGITADSFIVYFERVRDELREGRTLASAVESGWARAVRTIVVSDAVNLLAAVVLFVLAVGNVRGFAFTLGVTTVVDLVVVALFTHPLLQLLSRTSFFASGHPMSGLNPKSLGAVYRGRAQFVVDSNVTGAERGKVSKEARKRQTIAERRAADNGGES
ncbi:MAG: protein translocase subunit SecD [Microbacteriaceae bacterium]